MVDEITSGRRPPCVRSSRSGERGGGSLSEITRRTPIDPRQFVAGADNPNSVVGSVLASSSNGIESEMSTPGGRNEVFSDAEPIVAEQCSVRAVAFDAPWEWLSAGWRDMWAVPHVSLSYGSAFAIGAAVLLWGLFFMGWEALILVLAGGFLLIGPLMAIGLYETSRRLELGQRPALGEVAFAGLHPSGQLGFMGAILMLIYFAWVQIAFLLFMLFLGTGPLPPPSEFVPALLFTPRGLGLLIAGSLIGATLAGVVFMVSAVSVPLLLDRRIDVVTAMSASVAAARRNPKAMVLWAGLIAGLMLCGLATCFAGLVFVFPLIGHATWHAYRDLIAYAPGGR